MSLLRKMAQLLAMLACVGLSAWAIGCGDPNANSGTDGAAAADGATLDTATDAGTAAGDEAGSTTSDGGDAGVEPPPMPEGGGDEASTDTETETE